MTLAGTGPGQLQNVLLGNPTDDVEVPALFTAYRRFERAQHGTVTGVRHFFTHRLLLALHDFRLTEEQLLVFATSIPHTVDLDQHLGGRVDSGQAKVVAGDAGYLQLRKERFRILDFSGEVFEKGPFKGGL